jgi:hypothetical protein
MTRRLPGRTVAYPIATFTQVEGDKIRSEHVYLDRQTVAEQLGSKPSKPEALLEDLPACRDA